MRLNGFGGTAVGRPSFHELPALSQRIGAAIGQFSLVAGRMGERGLGDFAGK